MCNDFGRMNRVAVFTDLMVKFAYQSIIKCQHPGFVLALSARVIHNVPLSASGDQNALPLMDSDCAPGRIEYLAPSNDCYQQIAGHREGAQPIALCGEDAGAL